MNRDINRRRIRGYVPPLNSITPGVYHFGNNNDNERRPLPGGLAPKVITDDIQKLSKDPQVRAEVERLDMMRRIMENSDIIVNTQALIERGFIGRVYVVTTTAQRVVQARYLRGYIFLNREAVSGASLPFNFTNLLPSALRLAGATGNTQSTSVAVANYRNAMLWLDITAVVAGSTIQIDIQTRDPFSGNWAIAQSDIFGSPTAVGTYYANIGTLGVDRQFAIAFTVTGGTSSTFSLTMGRKDPMPGSSLGVNTSIFLGSEGVTSVSGYPLFEGSRESFFFRPNTELWAISQVAAGVALSVFELQ